MVMTTRVSSRFRVQIEGAAMQLGKRVCWILIASVLAGILWGCEELEDDEDEAEWQQELHIAPRPTPTPVGPWVTCLVPPLCNEYLTYNLQAWDEIFYSCRNSSDGRGCPFDYDLRCTIEYDDRDDIERRVLYGDADQISSVEFTRLCGELGGV